jgi:hypothetical protein
MFSAEKARGLSEDSQKIVVEATEGCSTTRASVPSGSSPQNSQANFVDLRHNRDFKTCKKFLKSTDA